MTEISTQSFVKWAGDKRQLFEQTKARLPEHFNEYMRSFVGGGTVYFDLQSEKSTTNDVNESLINAYLQIKISPEEFANAISEYDKRTADGGKEYYHKIWGNYNDRMMRAEYDIELAVLSVLLNKHCFNGLYRVNGRGLFNVPYNSSVRKSCSKESIMAILQSPRKTRIMKSDLQSAYDLAEKGDFAFISSPYAPLNPTSFESYTREGSDTENHRRLTDVFKELIEWGCYCMLISRDTDFISQLYTDLNKAMMDVKRTIDSDAKSRVGQEIVVTNCQGYTYGGADAGKNPGILWD